jgi:hypothetical protein
MKGPSSSCLSGNLIGAALLIGTVCTGVGCQGQSSKDLSRELAKEKIIAAEGFPAEVLAELPQRALGDPLRTAIILGRLRDQGLITFEQHRAHPFDFNPEYKIELTGEGKRFERQSKTEGVTPAGASKRPPAETHAGAEVQRKAWEARRAAAERKLEELKQRNAPLSEIKEAEKALAKYATLPPASSAEERSAADIERRVLMCIADLHDITGIRQSADKTQADVHFTVKISGATAFSLLGTDGHPCLVSFQSAKAGRPLSLFPFIAKMALFDDGWRVVSTRPASKE